MMERSPGQDSISMSVIMTTMKVGVLQILLILGTTSSHLRLLFSSRTVRNITLHASSKLAYFENGRLQDEIDITGCRTEKVSPESVSGFPHCIQMQKPGVVAPYLLMANSTKEADEWIEYLNTVSSYAKVGVLSMKKDRYTQIYFLLRYHIPHELNLKAIGISLLAPLRQLMANCFTLTVILFLVRSYSTQSLSSRVWIRLPRRESVIPFASPISPRQSPALLSPHHLQMK